DYRQINPDAYAAAYEALPEAIKGDLQAIYESIYRYPDWFPKIRYWVYDQFLKSQGVKEGIQSYSQISQLVAAYGELVDQ
ncbi:MAG: DUF3810 family protein, partial [Phaeodactylibacter sp.]|nr:DUF3810 family protein [Phaeodactylibacter sp.]